MLNRTRITRCLAVAVLQLAQVEPVGAQSPAAEEEARGFVGSVAASVYAAAWPTATYEGAAVKLVTRVGTTHLDVLVRLSGESYWGGPLWVDLAFEFHDGRFSDLTLRDHNAILVPPFQTSKTVAAMTLSLVQQAAGGQTDGRGPSPGPPSVAAPALRDIRVSSTCGYPIRLWLRYPLSASQSRVEGSWSLVPNDTTILADAENQRLRAAGPEIAYYAEIPEGGYAWSGTVDVSVGSLTLEMLESTLTVDPDGRYRLGLSCTNYVPSEEPPERPLVIGALFQTVVSNLSPDDTFDPGLQVIGLQEGFPAQRAGMAIGDIVVGVDGDHVGSMTQLRTRLNERPVRQRMITVVRGEESVTLYMVPNVMPVRGGFDLQRCQEVGNPPHYWVGAFAAPSAAPDGTGTVIPQYPGTAEVLFAPDELEIFYRDDPPEAVIVYGKSIREDIVRFDYYDRDRALLAITEAGDALDLGVRIGCLVQPGLATASEITLRRARDGREIGVRTVPLRQVN